METFLKILYSLYESFWRRWFGSDSWKYDWMNKRGIKHIVGGIITFIAIYFLNPVSKLKSFTYLIPNCLTEYSTIIITLYTVLIFQGLYWSRAHGPAFDMSRSGKPTEEGLRRYKKEWWNKFCEFLVPEEDWYDFGYDFLWMGFRYTVYTVLLIPVYGYEILFMGLVVPLNYGICWSLSEKNLHWWDTKIFKFMHITSATALAEYITGLVCGLILMFI